MGYAMLGATEEKRMICTSFSLFSLSNHSNTVLDLWPLIQRPFEITMAANKGTYNPCPKFQLPRVVVSKWTKFNAWQCTNPYIIRALQLPHPHCGPRDWEVWLARPNNMWASSLSSITPKRSGFFLCLAMPGKPQQTSWEGWWGSEKVRPLRIWGGGRGQGGGLNTPEVAERSLLIHSKFLYVGRHWASQDSLSLTWTNLWIVLKTGFLAYFLNSYNIYSTDHTQLVVRSAPLSDTTGYCLPAWAVLSWT